MPTQTAIRDDQLRAMIAEGWSPALFAEYWARPEAAYLRDMVTDDVVGHWPGGVTAEGPAAYIGALERLLAALPDIRLEVPDFAVNGDVAFDFRRVPPAQRAGMTGCPAAWARRDPPTGNERAHCRWRVVFGVE
jgi:hypothetical protein